MSTVFTTIGFICLAIICIFAFACFVFTFQYLAWFHWRSCKHCNHTLEYKGLKEDSNNGHYLFYCPKCRAWEQVSREEFYRDLDKGFNPNENIL